MGAQRICILGVAVGGQGGQTFGDWLCYTAESEGFYAIERGKPAVAQRGGPVDFYIEIPDQTGLVEDFIFSPEPIVGSIDLLIGGELLELTRAIQDGFAGPNCNVIGTSSRWFTTTEKLPLRDDLLTHNSAENYIDQNSRNAIVFDATSLAREQGLADVAANAILLGGLAASEFLPFKVSSFIEGITSKGAGSDSNLKAFNIGYEFVKSGGLKNGEEDSTIFSQNLVSSKELQFPYQQKLFLDNINDNFPELGEIVHEAASQIVDYQNMKLAVKYLQRVDEIYNWDVDQARELALTKEFSRALALRMTYEDAAKVAQEKLRPERLAWLMSSRNKRDLVKIHEVFSPDLEELYGLLPNSIVSPVVKWLGFDDKPTDRTIPMSLETTSVFGNCLLRFLKSFKVIRPYSFRYNREEKFVNQWMAAVFEFAALDYDLGIIVAGAADIVRGYGQTRHRSLTAWASFHELLYFGNVNNITMERIKNHSKAFLKEFYSGPEGSEKSVLFAQSIIGKSVGN